MTGAACRLSWAADGRKFFCGVWGMRGRAGRFGKPPGALFFCAAKVTCGRLSFSPQSPRRVFCQSASACFYIPFCRRARSFSLAFCAEKQRKAKTRKAQKTPRGQKPQGVEKTRYHLLYTPGERASFVRASTWPKTFLALAPGRPSAFCRKARIHRLFSVPAGKSVLLPFIAIMIVTQETHACQGFGASFCTICMICSAPRPYFSAMSRA